MEENVAAFVSILVVCSVSLLGCSVALRRRDSQGLPDRPMTCTMSPSLIRINPSAIGGSVRISAETARMCEMNSGTEGLMFRDRSDRQLPAEGFGEKRALRVMISADESLCSDEVVVSEEDARKLRLNEDCVLRLVFEVNRPPEVQEFNAYRGKVPVVGIPRPNVILQPVGPHKVRMPVKEGVRAEDGERRRLRPRR